MPKNMGIIGRVLDKIICCERKFEETDSYETDENKSAVSMQTAKCGIFCSDVLITFIKPL